LQLQEAKKLASKLTIIFTSSECAEGQRQLRIFVGEWRVVNI